MEMIEKLRQSLSDRVRLIQNIGSSSWKYRCFEELVLDLGYSMSVKPLPAYIQRGRPKSCFFNCQKLALEREDLIYVEGYAIPASVPVTLAHAWLLTPDGRAIDPTWENTGLGQAYLGVSLSTNWVNSFVNRRGPRGREMILSVFEGNYLEDYSLLKEGLPLEALSRGE